MNPGGWKTKTAGYLTGVYAVIGMALYFIGGPENVGAVAPALGIPLALGAFFSIGLRGAIEKVIKAITGK